MTHEHDYSHCPTCGHLHPGSVGLSMCLCTDCFLWFGDTPLTSLSPESIARLKELMAKARTPA